MKTKEAKKVKYVKSGAMCICRFTLERPLCMETFQVGIPVAAPRCIVASQFVCVGELLTDLRARCQESRIRHG